jgi:hypothetical protein
MVVAIAVLVGLWWGFTLLLSLTLLAISFVAMGAQAIEGRLNAGE